MLPAALVALGAALLTAVLDAIGAGVAASPAELLMWGALGVLFARVFEAAPLALAIPLLVAAVELGAGGLGAADAAAHPGASDPLTLALPGGGRLDATEVVFAAMYAAWAQRFGLRRRTTWAALAAALVVLVASDRALPPLTVLGGVFLLVNADRWRAAFDHS